MLCSVVASTAANPCAKDSSCCKRATVRSRSKCDVLLLESRSAETKTETGTRSNSKTYSVQKMVNQIDCRVQNARSLTSRIAAHSLATRKPVKFGYKMPTME